MSRKLEDLIPILAIKAGELQKAAKDLGLDMLVTSTWRPFAEQESLYAQGRTIPGKIVTWAKAGESYHNYGLAFDFAILRDHKVDWNDPEPYFKVGEIGEDMGLEWGGRWPEKKRDLPHLQMSFGLKIENCLNLYSQGGIQAVWAWCNRKYENGQWP